VLHSVTRRFALSSSATATPTRCHPSQPMPPPRCPFRLTLTASPSRWPHRWQELFSLPPLPRQGSRHRSPYPIILQVSHYFQRLPCSPAVLFRQKPTAGDLSSTPPPLSSPPPTSLPLLGRLVEPLFHPSPKLGPSRPKLPARQQLARRVTVSRPDFAGETPTMKGGNLPLFFVDRGPKGLMGWLLYPTQFWQQLWT
jgi:hypothetical protein